MANTYTLIASSTLATAAPSFDFTSISASFWDLRLHLSVRGVVAGNDANIVMTINNVSGNNYRSILQYANSNTTSQSSNNGYPSLATNMAWGGGIMPANGGDANAFMNGMLLIPGYRQTTNLAPFRGMMAYWTQNRTSGSNVFWGQSASQTSDTSAVNRITLTVSGGANFAVGSTVSLYGCTNT
jgi:hypothetical protein